MDPKQTVAVVTKKLLEKEAKALGKKKFTLTFDGKDLTDDETFEKLREGGFDDALPIIVKMPEGAAHDAAKPAEKKGASDHGFCILTVEKC